MSRIILIANRLPVTIKEESGKLSFTPSAGGLATGLKSLEGSYEKIWIGWHGLSNPDDQTKPIIDKELAKTGDQAL